MNAPTETALGLTESRSPGGRLLKALTYLLVLVVFAGPLLALLVSAFGKVKDPTQLSVIPSAATLDNFRIAFDQGVLAYLLNSFFVVGFGLLLQVAVSVLAGYALARKVFPGMTLVLVGILATLMLPEEILALPLSLILADLPVVHFNLIGTLAGMIVPLGVDETSPRRLKVRWNGACLVGFDHVNYPNLDSLAEEQSKTVARAVERWRKAVGLRLTKHELQEVGIDVFCIPFPDVDALRKAVRSKLGTS